MESAILFQNVKTLNFMSDSKLKEVLFFLPSKVQKRDRKLNNGILFPMVTFGVGKIDGLENVYNAVKVALEVGYRSFECDSIQEQEKFLGLALSKLLPQYNLQRSDIFITGKISPRDYVESGAKEALTRTCENLRTDYLDLYLMQWPGGHHLESDDEDNLNVRRDTWMEMMELKNRGTVRSIGVCNFQIKHLEYLRELKCTTPAVNQCEFHPRFPQRELLDYCNDRNILLQAISFENSFHPLLLNDGLIRIIGRRINKTPTQVLLKWILNKGVAVIPQSTKPKTIQKNFSLYDFVLEKPEMDAINAINLREKYLINPISVI